MISSKAASSSLCSSSMVLLVARTIRCGLPSTATNHRRIALSSPAALSSYSYSTSSYSSGGSDYDDDNEDVEEEEVDDGLDEIDISTAKENAIWTDDLVR